MESEDKLIVKLDEFGRAVSIKGECIGQAGFREQIKKLMKIICMNAGEMTQEHDLRKVVKN